MPGVAQQYARGGPTLFERSSKLTLGVQDFTLKLFYVYTKLNMRLLAIVCILFTHVNIINGQCNILVCKTGETGQLIPEVIDPFLCTHLMYHDYDFNVRTVLPNSSLTPFTVKLFSRLNSLKKRNPSLKTWFFLENKVYDDFFFIMYKNATSRKQYIQDTINFLRKHNFDGVVLYITVYEAKRSQPDKSKFVLLLQEMMSAFKAEKPSPGKTTLQVTVVLPCVKQSLDKDYDIPGMSRYADYIILESSFVNEFDVLLEYVHMSPLYGKNSTDIHSVDFYARYVISKGAAKTKLILSLTTKASYFLYNMHIKFGYFRDGSMDFLDVCLSLDKMVKKYDNVGKVPYAESKGDALMYENEDSLKLKVNYAKKSGFAGVCVFSLDSDDFLGLCFNRMLPLTNAVKIECRK
ncbi:Chitinase-3-like protein 1 [Bulinus truncatus]|nr:Chitinase-3-like protein 1 [Bulinus truncatus]